MSPATQRVRKMFEAGPSTVEAMASNRKLRKTIKPKPTLLEITPALISSSRFSSGVFFLRASLRASFFALWSFTHAGSLSSPFLAVAPPLPNTPLTLWRLTPHLVQYFVWSPASVPQDGQYMDIFSFISITHAAA